MILQIPARELSPHEQDVVDEVFEEIKRAVKLKNQGKFPETTFDKMARGDEHQAFDVLVEEVGEIAKSRNECDPVIERREEWVQVAAVAISAVLGFDSYYGEAGLHDALRERRLERERAGG